MIFRPANFLKRVRKKPHAATAALFSGGLGERNAMVAFCDASVNRKDLFGNLRADVFTLREVGIELRLFFRAERLNIFAYGRERNFRFVQSGFCGLDLAFGFLDGHHLFELAVFRGGGFGFGVRNFVLQRFVRFVGFYGSALIAIFSRALAPLIYVKLEFLALGLRVRMFFFRRRKHGAGSAQHRIGVFDALRKRFKFRAQRRDALIETL